MTFGVARRFFRYHINSSICFVRYNDSEPMLLLATSLSIEKEHVIRINACLSVREFHIEWRQNFMRWLLAPAQNANRVGNDIFKQMSPIVCVVFPSRPLSRKLLIDRDKPELDSFSIDSFPHKTLHEKRVQYSGPNQNAIFRNDASNKTNFHKNIGE